MEQVRELMATLAETRARAVYELYQEHGAPKAARMLGINRVNLYRIIRELPEVRAKHASAAAGATVVAMTVLSSLGTQAISTGGE